MPKRGADAVTGIGDDMPEPHAQLEQPVEFLQRQLGLGQRPLPARWHADFGAACRIIGPGVGQGRLSTLREIRTGSIGIGLSTRYTASHHPSRRRLVTWPNVS